MPFDLHKVFYSTSSDHPNYLNALTLFDKSESMLRLARDEIRSALQQSLGKWGDVIAPEELVEARVIEKSKVRLRPKFRMQGSFAYRTCNNPATTPPQQVDLDDGVFFPLTFLTIAGGTNPVVLSTGIFAAVERILSPLAAKKGWKLIKDKPSCVRLEIAKDAHVDLALYAIPDAEFQNLVESEVLTKSIESRQMERTRLLEEQEVDSNLYRQLASDQIMLAHRVEGWKPSDPRKLEDWFDAALKTYGEELRRICRYLKGWRDFQWPACTLSSIALMACVVKAYQDGKVKNGQNRDDKSLFQVANALQSLLAGAIVNPVVDGQRLDEGWTAQQRKEFGEAASSLAEALDSASNWSANEAEAIAELQKAFGDRIPSDEALVLSESGGKLEVKSATAVSSIAILSDAERLRRAELAAQTIESQGTPSKPWVAR